MEIDPISFGTFGEAAIGTIEADADRQERLDELTDRVGSGEFNTLIGWPEDYGKLTFVRCVDGRMPADGMNPLGPNSAGGSESLFVADDLTEKLFAADDDSTAGGYRKTLEYLVETGYELGGHTDTHATATASGCGANDKLALIYDYIARRGDVLRHLAEELGVAVSDEAHSLIMANAASRLSFSDGRELLDELESRARPEFVDHLDGGHREVLTSINTRQDTTLDRDALAAEFGANYQVFNVDAWAFESAARAISTANADRAVVDQKVVALAYYNLATALVLSGPAMRYAVVS